MGYKGYPKSTCISPNHIVCHGIPGDKKLLDGDIINIDVTVILDGWYGDTSRMYLVGDHVSIKARRLVAVTYESLVRGIDAAAKPSATLGDVGYAIQSYAEGEGFFRRARFLRTRTGPRFSHGAVRFAFRQPRRRHQTTSGHVSHHRADDQCRQVWRIKF